jgi:hypothetical protein
LRRHHDSHAEQQRDAEPFPAQARQRAGLHARGHETRGGAGDEEQQAEAPGIEEHHDRFQRIGRVGGFDVVVPGHEHHADMVEDQQAEGAHPHPVEVGPAGGLDGFRRDGQVDRGGDAVRAGSAFDRFAGGHAYIVFRLGRDGLAWPSP